MHGSGALFGHFPFLDLTVALVVSIALQGAFEQGQKHNNQKNRRGKGTESRERPLANTSCSRINNSVILCTSVALVHG